MLKIDKTGVSTSKRVYFRMFLPSLASVMAARPCFLLVLALCCRSTCQFRGNSEKSNHMLSATSHIGLEFLTKFLNMSKLQNRLILLYQSLPLQFIKNLECMHGCNIENYPAASTRISKLLLT